jgi:hypothetical protein
MRARAEHGATERKETDVDNVLSSEADGFIRVANLAGLELPATITEQLDRLESLGAERARLTRPEPVPSRTKLLANGVSVDKVSEEYARLDAEARELLELHKAIGEAKSVVARHASILFAQERGNLILAMRPIVTALIDAARPLAESLAPFAPKYDAGAIVRRASTKQVKDWREAEELEAVFGACLAAWRSAWNASTTLGGHPSPEQVRGFDTRWVDQAHYYWSWPDRVLEPRLNGTYYAPYRQSPSVIRPTLLAVACERPECGFRLATVAEMAEMYRTGQRGKQVAGGGMRYDTAPV